MLTRLAGAGLKMKPKKCFLFKPEVRFLGHIVSPDGIKVNGEETEAAEEWPEPTNVKEVQGVLGFCSYYPRFMKNFPDIAAPLRPHQEESQVSVEQRLSDGV